jgi:hypothetical protein
MTAKEKLSNVTFRQSVIARNEAISVFRRESLKSNDMFLKPYKSNGIFIKEETASCLAVTANATIYFTLITTASFPSKRPVLFIPWSV